MTTPYYQDLAQGVVLYHGRCEEVLPTLRESVTLLLTDPPYGVVSRASGGLRNLDKGKADSVTVEMADWLPHALSLTTGTAYVWCSTEQVSDLRRALIQSEMTTRLCVWEKSNPSPMNGQYLWLSSLEVCVFGRRKKAPFHEHCASPVFRGPIQRSPNHETPKPTWLMKRLILASSNSGDTVLDPFVGSGTTLLAARELHRRCIAIEVDKATCDNIVRALKG